MVKRQLPDLLPAFFRLMQPFGGKPYVVYGQCHARSKPRASEKEGAEI
jgi:hypothetical protein